MAQPSPFLDLLEERPELAYYSRVGDRYGNSARGRRLRSQFRDVHSQFLGALGSQIRGGDMPTLRFNNWLDDFDFDRQFYQSGPYGRGSSSMFSVPKVRHLLRF